MQTWMLPCFHPPQRRSADVDATIWRPRRWSTIQTCSPSSAGSRQAAFFATSKSVWCGRAAVPPLLVLLTPSCVA